MQTSDNLEDSGYNKDDFGKTVEKVDLNNLTKVNNTEHEHQWVRDVEETEDYYAMKCVHPRCFRGFLVQKSR